MNKANLELGFGGHRPYHSAIRFLNHQNSSASLLISYTMRFSGLYRTGRIQLKVAGGDGLHECTWEWSVGPYGPIRAYALAMAGRDGCRIIPRVLIETLASG